MSQDHGIASMFEAMTRQSYECDPETGHLSGAAASTEYNSGDGSDADQSPNVCFDTEESGFYGAIPDPAWGCTSLHP